MAAGLARASAVVVTYLDLPAAKKVLGHIQGHAPQVPVVVRTQDDHELEALQKAGATEVVPEAIEGSLMLATHALALVGVPMRRVIRVVQEQRDARYALLRGFFHGADDDLADDRRTERLVTLTLPEGALSIGKTIGSCGLDNLQVQVVSLRRGAGKPLGDLEDVILMANDSLVLSGRVEPLALAEQTLLARK